MTMASVLEAKEGLRQRPAVGQWCAGTDKGKGMGAAPFALFQLQRHCAPGTT